MHLFRHRHHTICHDDVFKWKHFPRYWPLCAGNKHRNMRVGWCLSSWSHRFWSVYSIYNYIHTMCGSCIWLIESLVEFHLIAVVVIIAGILMPLFLFWTTRLGFLGRSSSGSADVHLPGCFRPWTFPLNIGLNMLPSDSFMSCLDFLLGYSTGEFQAVQLIVLAVFGVVDYPLASCV